MVLTREKSKLFDFVQRHFKSIQKQILDLAEVSVPADHWDAFRSKVLRITNDSRRVIEGEIVSNYEIKYTPQVQIEDVIEVKGASSQALTPKEDLK